MSRRQKLGLIAKIIDQRLNRGECLYGGHDSVRTEIFATTFISGIRGPRNKLASEVTLCTSVERKKKKKKKRRLLTHVEKRSFGGKEAG